MIVPTNHSLTDLINLFTACTHKGFYTMVYGMFIYKKFTKVVTVRARLCVGTYTICIILFNLDINDIVNVSEKIKFVFADDNTSL